MIREGLKEIFRRTPGRYESVDGIRALAVIWVIFFHVLFVWGESVSSAQYETVVHSSWNWLWTKGYLAINPFFVISGFLIGDLLQNEISRKGTVALRSFYLRRFFRLAPAYYLVLVGFIGFWFYDSSFYTLRTIWTNFIYVNNWFPHQGKPAIWAWSLAVEEQFYILCPLFLLALSRKRIPPGPTILGLIALSIGWNYYIAVTQGPFKVIYHPTDDLNAYFHFFDETYSKTTTRASAILMGVGCAFLKRDERWMIRLRSSVGTGILTFAFLAISFVSFNPAFLPPRGSESKPVVTALFNPLSAFSFACLLMLLQTERGFGKWASRFLSARIWFPFAQVSYGLYLLHCIVTDAFYRLVPPSAEITLGRLTLNAFGVLAVTAVFAVLLNVLIETPMRKIGYRLARGKEVVG
jgi:peptidoglycan/LPS O-acetylase OafA/YrhL